MYYDLTKGKISKNLILFALPMMAGNLMQLFYNIADTLIVGRVVGKNALAAVGSAYTLMTFLTSSMRAGSGGACFCAQHGSDGLRSRAGVCVYASYSVVSTCATGSHGGDAAVGHEFWNSDGAGACKQFRGNNDGGICGSGQN